MNLYWFFLIVPVGLAGFYICFRAGWQAREDECSHDWKELKTTVVRPVAWETDGFIPTEVAHRILDQAKGSTRTVYTCSKCGVRWTSVEPGNPQ